jgi:hypothetical protein
LEVEMSSRARRLGGALSLLALLSLVAAALASASSPPPPITQTSPGKVRKVGQSDPKAPTNAPAAHAIGYRLSAKLAPSSSTSSATGRWDGVLVHTIGTVRNGTMPSVPGCSVTGPKPGKPGQPGAPPRASGIPHTIKCKGGAVPPFTVPSGSGQHWILGWKLTYSNLSSAVSGAQIRITAPTGSAPVAAAALCSTCTSGKFGRTMLTDDQAAAILKGEASVVVSTANNPDGEISGPIVKAAPTTTH